MILLVGGFNPSEQYARQNGNLPQIGVKINISETTTQTRSFVLNTSIQRQYNTTADGIRKQSNRNQKRYQYYSLTVTYYKQTNKQTINQVKTKQIKTNRNKPNHITSHQIKSNKSIPIHQIFQSAAFEHIPSHFFFLIKRQQNQVEDVLSKSEQKSISCDMPGVPTRWVNYKRYKWRYPVKLGEFLPVIFFSVSRNQSCNGVFTNLEFPDIWGVPFMSYHCKHEYLTTLLKLI